MTIKDFGRIAVVDRRRAATNPGCLVPRPSDHARGPPRHHARLRGANTPPARLCGRTNDEVALVVTSVERARDLRGPGAVIESGCAGAASGDGELMTSSYHDDIAALPGMRVIVIELWAQVRAWNNDISTAFLYDRRSPRSCFMQLDLRLLRPRAGRRFRPRRAALSLGGGLPIDAGGGFFDKAYIHGMNSITECVRQVSPARRPDRSPTSSTRS